MVQEYELRPRLCTIRKWADFAGYGFNLHAERGRAGQYIGKVDDNSPAQAAGMKEGDRIVEVNGVNIGNENHSQVVTRIKSAGDHVTMLLVDPETDKHFKEQKVVVSSDMPEVVQLETPPRSGTDAEDDETPPPAPDSEPPTEEPPTEEPPSYEDAVPDDEKADSSRSASPQPEADPEPDDEPEPMPVAQLDAVSEPITHKYHPRLCHIRKWPDFQGYGFNLHSEKDRQGQYIGLVDPGSPSEDADLRKGDRIIEVNGDNIEEVAHANVIQKIKAGGDETILLVVDIETDEYYKNNGIKITSSLPEVVRNETKPRETPAMTYIPRLCHLVKWHDFNGYGFNLHAEKERGAQFIGKIDDNSPALAAGLREHDRIIEVNGVNIENETHQQVIARIKAGGDETKLLVVDKDADNHYKSRGVTVKSSMSEVKEISAMRRTAPAVATNGSPAPAPSHAPIQAPVSQPTRTEKPAEQPTANGGGDLMLNLSAKEMRERLASKRKTDPKQRSNMDFKSKYEIFQKM